MCNMRFKSVFFALTNACCQMSAFEDPNIECENYKNHPCKAVFALKKRIPSKIESASFAIAKPRNASPNCVLHISKTHE